MKMLRFGMLLSAVIGILLVSLPAARASRSESRAGVQALGLKGHYLGQKPPGKTPELFAPDVFRDVQFHDSPSFSRDGTELFASVTGNNEQFRYFRSTGVTWSREAAPFDVPTYLNGLFLSPSGRRLYLLVDEDGRENFYYLERREGRWSKRQSLGSEVNSLTTHWSFSVASSEDLYFASKGDLYQSRFDGQKHTRPVRLPAALNTSADEMTPFVAPDESYILFARNDGNRYDLFVSFRLRGDSWSEAVALGPGVNVPGVDDICPMVSPDGKFLFFVSRRINRAFRAFWVDAEVIEDLRRGNGVVR